MCNDPHVLFSTEEYWEYLFFYNPDCERFEGLLLVLFDLVNTLIDQQMVIKYRNMVDNTINSL